MTVFLTGFLTGLLVGVFMADRQTILAYDKRADEFVSEWLPKTPVDLQELIERYFTKGSRVLDVGSGSGRDVHWLVDRGFQAEGVDASEGLLSEARSRYPSQRFRFDALPLLPATGDGLFDNVLCSAVLMHLPEDEMTVAAANLRRVMKPGGILICSVRPSRSSEEREVDGRLYTNLDVEKLGKYFGTPGWLILDKLTSEAQDAGRVWHTIVAKKARV